MNPDRAHRLLNTILLVFIIGIVSLGDPKTAGLWENLHAVGFYGAMVALVFLMLKIAADNVGEIRDYLGLSRRSA